MLEGNVFFCRFVSFALQGGEANWLELLQYGAQLGSQPLYCEALGKSDLAKRDVNAIVC